MQVAIGDADANGVVSAPVGKRGGERPFVFS